MASDSPNPFFKEPHSHSELLGNLTCRAYFVTSKEFPNTCAACSNLAKALDNDNQSRQKGTDNYTTSFEKLFQMLDTFIKEKSKGKETAGYLDNYPFSDDCKFTIRLLWQIRNTMAHSGAVTDQKCKTKYEKIFREKGETTRPIIALPNTLKIGQKFVIQHKDFKKIQDCVFNFIKQQVQKEDYSIFERRANMANFQIHSGLVHLPLPEGILIFNIRKASAHGININPKTMKVMPPPGTIFSFEDSRIHLKDGDSFPAKYIPKSEYDENMMPDLDL